MPQDTGAGPPRASRRSAGRSEAGGRGTEAGVCMSLEDKGTRKGLGGGTWQPRLVAISIACWVIGIAVFVWMLVLAAR
ncbi:MAG TPA: hypothetical protein VM242_12315 [Acidimicrobiales bacterium]|nr:hypothetical protein [Acidimicrobiales bacterium]